LQIQTRSYPLTINNESGVGGRGENELHNVEYNADIKIVGRIQNNAGQHYIYVPKWNKFEACKCSVV